MKIHSVQEPKLRGRRQRMVTLKGAEYSLRGEEGMREYYLKWGESNGRLRGRRAEGGELVVYRYDGQHQYLSGHYEEYCLLRCDTMQFMHKSADISEERACLHVQRPGRCFSETSVEAYPTTRRYIPEGSNYPSR
jgi:hypothetical protein